MEITGNQMRRVLLEIINEYDSIGSGYLQTVPVLNEASKRLGIRRPDTSRNLELQQGLLTYWHDLFRTGYLAWGYDINSPEPPFCHLTEQGRNTLKTLSRDPANPDGYLEHLSRLGTLSPIAESYIQEGLKTYNSDCFKAAAVMIGAAVESIVLELRQTLVQRIQTLGRSPSRNLQDWRIRRVLSAIKIELDTQKGNMPSQLAEAFEAYWPAFTQQVRVARNEAGHPSSIEPVTHNTVHASLLIFPELIKLAFDLRFWILNNYS